MVAEVLHEALRFERAARVDVVVPGDDADVARGEAELFVEEAAHCRELLVEGEVREIAGDDDVIRAAPLHLLRDRPDEARVVDVPALEAEDGVAGDALVQEALGAHAVEIVVVEIGEVGDAHRGLGLSRSPLFSRGAARGVRAQMAERALQRVGRAS